MFVLLYVYNIMFLYYWAIINDHNFMDIKTIYGKNKNSLLNYCCSNVLCQLISI